MPHERSYLLSCDATNSDFGRDPKNCKAEGLLLVGHGTRETAGVAEFLAVAELVRQRTATLVEPCFLELARPTIAEGVARLAERGARRITVVPALLFAAGHAKRDIPLAVAETAVGFPELSVRYAAPLECHDRVLELSARRFREAVGAADVAAVESPFDAAETLLVMVGRGSSDLAAKAEMLRFSKLRRDLTPVSELETCFVARQSPLLADALPRVAASGFRRIVVQPHLLCKGQLLDDIRREVESASGCRLPPGLPASVHAARRAERSQGVARARVQWIMTAPLGAEPEIAEAILALAANCDALPDQANSQPNRAAV